MKIKDKNADQKLYERSEKKIQEKASRETNSLELKYDKFNFLRGAERYKYSLGGEDEKIYQISI